MDGSLAARECAREMLDSLALSNGDLAEFARTATASLQRLMAHPDLLTLGIERQANHAEWSMFLYYDNGFNITLSQIRHGVAIPVHDHGTWELVGVYRGAIEHILYRRLDDGTRPGYADVEPLETRVLKQFDVAGAFPGLTSEIHGFRALADETYIAVAVGGNYKSNRHYFNVDDGTYLVRNQRSWRSSALR